jgi:ABC-type microcin C transport system permease subunit YejE
MCINTCSPRDDVPATTTPRGNPDEGSSATAPRVLATRIALIFGASLALAYIIIGGVSPH